METIPSTTSRMKPTRNTAHATLETLLRSPCWLPDHQRWCYHYRRCWLWADLHVHAMERSQGSHGRPRRFMFADLFAFMVVATAPTAGGRGYRSARAAAGVAHGKANICSTSLPGVMPRASGAT